MNSGPTPPYDEQAVHYPAYPAYSEDLESGNPGMRYEIRDGLLCALVVAVLGVGLGLLWLWLAPRVPLVTVDNAVFLKDPEGEEAVGADGTFVLLALGFGVVTGALAFLRSRAGGVGIVVGLAVGALLGSVLAWRLGVWLGPSSDLVAAAKAAGPGKTFHGPLKLQAKSALLVWPLLALLMHLLLIGVFGKREPEFGEPMFVPPGGPGGPGAPQSW
ncbi:ABC transporter permease [Streptomyces albidus (ex Kaewkla and Franco 2022)]|uniref:ABC transporter permease n=1 Tax=Streptomyces albidus (ex Kaewkla and Franco 2022) TaxID=722709 RepID=UPI0015EEBD8F|nr:ABC transporter permease [Streptomyces albidus (ex Kaewkla and Franco 2022)]